MIKLEDLHKGDIIYGVCKDDLYLNLYTDTIITQELSNIDTYPNTTEAVMGDGGMPMITRSYEKYLFKTKQEAEDEFHKLQLQTAKDLLKDNRFLDRLFECATSSKRLQKYSEIPIYKLAIQLYKENHMERNNK